MMPNVGVSDTVAPYVGQAPSAQGGGNVAIFLSLTGSQNNLGSKGQANRDQASPRSLP